MYVLTGRDKNGNIRDDKIPNEFALQHDAAYCGQYYPNPTDFAFQIINDNLTSEEQSDIS